MPSAFETQMAAAGFPALYAAYGVAAVYTDPNGNVTSGLTVRVHRGEFRQVDGHSGEEKQVQSGQVYVLQSALSKPTRGGRFQIDNSTEVWTIASLPMLKNGQFHCECERTGLERMLPRRARD